MKKLFPAIIGVVLVAIIAFFVKSNQDYHYALLQQNGAVVVGTKPLKFEDLEWKDTGHGQVFIPFLDGHPVLCKVGDQEGAMYSYHPFSASGIVVKVLHA